MRRLAPPEAITRLDEVFLGYDRDEATAEAQRALQFDLEQANARCPFDVDVARFVGQVAAGDFDAAMATIREAHPWPEVLGRHCHKFCEYYKGIDSSERPFLSALEWAAGRHGDPTRSPFRPGAPTGRRIAIVGAGSAGLACAWELRRFGHDVDVYDLEPLPSGLLFTGYPSFRMNKQVVLREHQPLEWGVHLHLYHHVDAAELQRLVAEYDAVFVGVGRKPVPRLGVDGEDLEGVWTGLDMLRATWYGFQPRIGPRVAVVGAGYTAVDVVRLALRLGCAPVQMLYRRGVDEMPLNPGRNSFFVAMIEAEGVICRFMTSVLRIRGHHGRVAAVDTVQMEYGASDASGRRSVQPIPGSEQTIEVDTVIRAIGETSEVAWLVQPLGAEITEEGFVVVDPVTRQTAHPKLWAGGDMIGSKGNDGAAVDGLWAARAIDASLTGRLPEWRAAASLRVKDMTQES
jgi:NADPH-dependent glutamate synthase beta subunit-like oxidoreductase